MKRFSWLIALIAVFSLTLSVLGQAGPAPDRDGDGVPDSSDLCISDSGPASNSGCPVPVTDRDGDGVSDDIDQCPDTNGANFNNGCPVEPTATPEPETQPVDTTVVLPTLPTTGDCVVATATNSRVNVRNSPSPDGIIIGVLEPIQTAAVDYFLELDGIKGESLTYVLADILISSAQPVRGFIDTSVLRFGGDCTQVPTMELPTSTGPFIIRSGDANDDGNVDTGAIFVLRIDLFGTNRPDFDPTKPTIFVPNLDDDPLAATIVEYAVSFESSPQCDDILVFDPNTPIPGCLVITNDPAVNIYVMCKDLNCWIVLENLPLGSTESTRNVGTDCTEAWCSEPLSQVGERVVLAIAEPVDPTDPTPPSLFFVPNSSPTGGAEAECAEVSINLGIFSISGCLIFTDNLVALCVSDVCIYAD